MIKVGLWQIGENAPVKIRESQVNIEKELEDWIAADPSLIRADLKIVARQLLVEGGYLDLLALDPQGRWVVVELKRGELRREVIAQVLDYASCLALLEADELREKINAYLQARGETIEAVLAERSAEDALDIDGRELVLVVVGTGKAAGLERMTEFLATQYQIPISVVTFGVFKMDNGNQILVRELTEPEVEIDTPPPKKRIMLTLEEVLKVADSTGVGEDFRAILEVSKKYGLYPRPYKKSIMYTPPFKRNRMLFTVYTENYDNRIKLWVGPSPFTEFYAITEDEVVQALNVQGDGWQMMDSEQVADFIQGLHALFGKIEKQAT